VFAFASSRYANMHPSSSVGVVIDCALHPRQPKEQRAMADTLK